MSDPTLGHMGPSFVAGPTTIDVLIGRHESQPGGLPGLTCVAVAEFQCDWVHGPMFLGLMLACSWASKLLALIG